MRKILAAVALLGVSIGWAQIQNPPSSAAPSGTASGDLGGTYPSPTVTGLNGTAIAANGLITPYALDTSVSANSVLITVSNLPTAVTTGSCVAFKAANAATGATTMTVTPTGQSAYAAINLMKRIPTGVAALSTTDVLSGGIYQACYDGTQWVLQNTSAAIYSLGSIASGAMARGNGSNQISGSAGIVSSAGNVFTTYGGAGLTTAGLGVPPIYGAVSNTSQTAAVSTATLCTAALCGNGSAGMYDVHWNFWGSGTACSSVTAGSVTFLLTWTDENAVTHAAVALQMMSQTGAATTAMGGTFPFQTALANESASGIFTISTNGTIVQYATGYTACTTGTGTYNLRASISRHV